MINMCIEITNYKALHSNNFDNYFNLKNIDEDAQTLLHNFYSNPDYINFNLSSFKNKATPIITIAKIMGFKVLLATFEDENLSGTIGISENLINEFNSDKVIILNKKETDKHILFTLAHELAHYIYDYVYPDDYSNTYRINEIQTDKEIRANRFAAGFLMPKKLFIEIYETNNNIEFLSNYFNVPETAVKLRINELELH